MPPLVLLDYSFPRSRVSQRFISIVVMTWVPKIRGDATAWPSRNNLRMVRPPFSMLLLTSPWLCLHRSTSRRKVFRLISFVATTKLPCYVLKIAKLTTHGDQTGTLALGPAARMSVKIPEPPELWLLHNYI